MAELHLDGGQQSRPMWLPVLLALVVLAAMGGWFAKVYLHPAVVGSIEKVSLFPVHSEYKRGSGILVGETQSEDALYVLVQVAVTNKGDLPLFVKEISGTMTVDDTEVHATAMQADDVPRLLAMFPALKPIADTTGAVPLKRELEIAKGAAARGFVVLSYNVPVSVWQRRKAADVSIGFYHTDTIRLKLPK